MMMTLGLFCVLQISGVVVLGAGAKRSRRGADATDLASVVYFFCRAVATRFSKEKTLLGFRIAYVLDSAEVSGQAISR